MQEEQKKAGRPKGSRNVHHKPDNLKVVSRSVCLYPNEWEQLQDAAIDGSATAEAARRLRKTLE